MYMNVRKRTGLLAYLAVVLILFAGGIYTLPAAKKQSGISTPTASPAAPVTIDTRVEKISRIIDGDTVETEDGNKIRYIGIDTPETKHPVKKVQCFGKEAALKNKELVEGRYVRLEKDVSETDRYGRLLRYVRVFDSPEASGEGMFVNEYLVRQGYAYAATFPPDVKYAEVFKNAQDEARESQRGLWKNCQ